MHIVLSKITFLAYKKKGKRKDCLKGNAYSLRRCLQYVISKIILFLDEAEWDMKNMQIEEVGQGGKII